MDAKEFLQLVTTVKRLDRAIRKAKAPNQIVESYLAAMQNELVELQAYIRREASRMVKENAARANQLPPTA